MKKRLRNLIFIGLLIAIGVILNQLLSFYYPPSTAIIKFGIGYVPLIIISIIFGPVYGIFSGVIFDVIGYFMLGSTRGAFYFGFTINSMIYGLIPYFLVKFKLRNRSFNYFYINIAILSIFALFSVLYLFDINAISTSDSFDILYRYLLVGVSVIVNLILFIISLRQYQKFKQANDFQMIFFIVIVLYMITSLLLTPIWVSDLYDISIWAQLPLRIIKMPIEVFLYTVILEKLLKSIASYANFK